MAIAQIFVLHTALNLDPAIRPKLGARMIADFRRQSQQLTGIIRCGAASLLLSRVICKSIALIYCSVGHYTITKRILINASFLGVDSNCRGSHCYRCHLDSSGAEELVSLPLPRLFGLHGCLGWIVTIQDIRNASIAAGLEDEQILDATGWGSWDTQRAGGSGCHQLQCHGANHPYATYVSRQEFEQLVGRVGATEQVLQNMNMIMGTLCQQFSGFMSTWSPSDYQPSHSPYPSTFQPRYPSTSPAPGASSSSMQDPLLGSEF